MDSFAYRLKHNIYMKIGFVLIIIGIVIFTLATIAVYYAKSYIIRQTFVVNQTYSKPEAVKLENIYNQLPAKFKNVLSDRNVKIEFTSGDSPKYTNNNYQYDKESGILYVRAYKYGEAKNYDSSGMFIGPYNNMYVFYYNEINFLSAIGSILQTDTSIVSNKGLESILGKDGGILSDGYTVAFKSGNISQTECVINVNVQNDVYFNEAFALYYSSEPTNSLLKKSAPVAYKYIKSLSI